MTVVGLGRGDRLASVASGTLSAHGNRVLDTTPGLSSWYAAGPLGVEQGFTVVRRPHAGSGDLTVALALGGSLRARMVGASLELMTRSGAVALRYGGLRAVDAHGRPLRSTLALRGRTVLLSVADRDASFPVRIDPFVQQGAKLPVPAGATADALFGDSAAVSADGSTALIGAEGNNDDAGAAWVFTKSTSGTWTQQAELLPSDASAQPFFGVSVALSSNGNTALIGGSGDTGSASTTFTGAAWVFNRSGTTWSQDGAKLVGGMNETGKGEFGESVALSGDGTSALIGSPDDSSNGGAVFTYSSAGTVWTQRDKLRQSGSDVFGSSLAMSTDGSTALISDPGAANGSGVTWVYAHSGSDWLEQQELAPDPSENPQYGSQEFGSALALSADGNTGLIAAKGTTNSASTVFTRSGTTWSEQALLVPSDAVPGGAVGGGVALSADGNTALVGEAGDNGQTGAAWSFGRSGSSWVQEGPKLLPSDATGASDFGAAVALSSDGASALISGYEDSSESGAAWSFTNAPSIQTNPATGVDRSDATFNGTLAAGATTSLSFQYGTSTAYGSQSPTVTAPSSGGSTPVSAALTGLVPGTTYHYRLVATNSAGTTDGADQSFTTSAPIPATTTVIPGTTTVNLSSSTPTVSPTTQTTSVTVDNQTLKLVSPSVKLCTAIKGKLKLSLSARKLSKGTKLTFSHAQVYLDKGVAHRKREKVRGKLRTVTTYTANATVKRLPATLGLSVKGLKAGTHTVRVVVTLTHVVVLKHHRRTVTVSRTLRTTFRVC
jgi:hypothetical protein